MKGFGGFKSSPAQLKTNYKKGFENMTNKELKAVVNRHKDRGSSRKTAFNSEKEAEISIDSLNTAKKELNRRKLDKMDPSGRIRKSRLLPKKSSPTKANKNLVDIAGEIGKKGNDMLKKMFDTPVTRAYKKFKKAKDAYKNVKLPKTPKTSKKVKYPKVGAAIKPAQTSTDKYFKNLNTSLKTTKRDKTKTLNFQPVELTYGMKKRK
mgnify:CR=1 FL=1